MYVMNTKLTLRLDDVLVEKAKAEAGRRGKSVSRMVAEFFESLGRPQSQIPSLPPLTRSLVGVLKGRISEADYNRHLQEKYQ